MSARPAQTFNISSVTRNELLIESLTAGGLAAGAPPDARRHQTSRPAKITIRAVALSSARSDGRNQFFNSLIFQFR
jgi:hypothetical protein